MNKWTNEKPGEHRLDLGCGDVLVVHGGTASRAHMTVMQTFWHSGNLAPEDCAILIAAPVDRVKREALKRARDALHAALAAVEAEIATPTPASDTLAR